MKVRYGKWILTKPAQIIDLLTKKDQQIADAEAARIRLAEFADALLDQHQPYWRGRHRDGFDLSTAPTGGLAQRLRTQMAAELWCVHCRSPWPCRTLAPLRVLAKELRYPSDKELPDPPAPPKHENLIPVYL